MKIFEVVSFEPQNTSKSFDARKEKIGSVSSEIGKGYFGSVYKPGSAKRQGEVVKTGVVGHMTNQGLVRGNNISDDGYVSYLKMVHDYRLAGKDNPCFPKFSNFKLFKENNGQLHYVANLEHLTSLSSENIVSNTKLLNDMEQKYFNVNDPKYQHEQQWSRGFADLASNILCYAPQAIKDKQLADAVSIIQNFANKNNFGFDLGPNNMMLRMAGNIPQLVITDPLS